MRQPLTYSSQIFLHPQLAHLHAGVENSNHSLQMIDVKLDLPIAACQAMEQALVWRLNKTIGPFGAGGNYANTAIEARTHPYDIDWKHYFVNFDFDVGVE